MRKHLIVNTKGFSLEQAILAMHQNLEKIGLQDETKHLQIQSMNFVNTFEKPQKSSLDLNGGNQPVIVYNCCVLLVEPGDHNDKVENLLMHLSAEMSSILTRITKFMDEDYLDDVTPEPSPGEVEQLKRSASFFCQHPNLHPTRYQKDHRNPDQYYQICRDCGAEVWQGLEDDQTAGPGIPFMKAVPADPGSLPDAGDPAYKDLP